MVYWAIDLARSAGGDFEHLVPTLRAAFSAIGRPCPPSTWRSLLGRARAGDGWHPGVTQRVWGRAKIG
ncbi:hypothetical protein AB0M64_35720 [Streptomyces sp. NPDC051771]|uniref:hypothetical protein n=1 Tax=Streptomyces sp. NPDC051771 TaxID=3154847 RepID=UPI003427463C